ncbi:hypothetical protein N7462_009824 [Penicillium macrosclerotiorum]|uniref:uncharacterized protein n=1 Tax=Penicillium macrosclerotiorum TaxID=303699 RepID=UPI002546FE34|nr:uncharacterized protein N7462_009824 [Penicillium macrosclerotiorum]KAJ5668754.1 hypothetical protein N7462_009824 [Penicillium macrosclerotiorum]
MDRPNGDSLQGSANGRHGTGNVYLNLENGHDVNANLPTYARYVEPDGTGPTAKIGSSEDMDHSAVNEYIRSVRVEIVPVHPRLFHDI